MSLFDIEKIHEKYLNDLIINYGNKEKIKSIYNTKRKELEERAKTNKFVPVLTFKQVQKYFNK